MPLITYEESCRIRGLSPEACKATGEAEAARVRDAADLCDTAFQHDLNTRNACVRDCIAYSAAHQDIQASYEAQQLHIYAAVLGLVLMIGAYLLGRRHRR
jgi:hypothetical protein